LDEIGLRLDPDDVRTGLGEDLDLLGVRFARRGARHAAVRREPDAQRSHGAGDELGAARVSASLRCGVPGDLDPSPVDLLEAALEAVRLQVEAIRTEGVRLDDLRPRFDELAM